MKTNWFVKIVPLVWLLAGQVTLLGAHGKAHDALQLQYQSAFLRIRLAQDQPAFLTLVVDSLGKGKLSTNPLRLPGAPSDAFQIRRIRQKIEYRPLGAPLTMPPAWTFEFSVRQIRLRSSYSTGNPPPSLVLNFDPNVCHATLLGLMNADGSVRLPALLHLPDHGTFRITSTGANGLALALFLTALGRISIW